MTKPTGESYGLREGSLSGSISIGGKSSPASFTIEFKDALHALLHVQGADGVTFSIEFMWHHEVEAGEVWFNAVKLQHAGGSVAVRSVGKLVGGVLHATVTAQEAFEVAGASATEVVVDATQVN